MQKKFNILNLHFNICDFNLWNVQILNLKSLKRKDKFITQNLCLFKQHLILYMYLCLLSFKILQKSLFSSGLRNLFSIDYYHKINVIKHEVFTIILCVYLYFTANRNPWGPNFPLIPCNIKLVWVFEISCAKLGKVRFFQTLIAFSDSNHQNVHADALMRIVHVTFGFIRVRSYLKDPWLEFNN